MEKPLHAAAQEQLALWSEELNIEIVAGKYKGDPAAVAFDTVSRAKARNVDLVLIDTAGILENKTALIKELEKIKCSCQKAYGEISISVPHETFLVLDATTGQNGLEKATPITVSLKVHMFSSNTNSRSQCTHDDSDTENEQRDDQSSNNVDVPTDYQLSDTLLEFNFPFNFQVNVAPFGTPEGISVSSTVKNNDTDLLIVEKRINDSLKPLLLMSSMLSSDSSSVDVELISYLAQSAIVLAVNAQASLSRVRLNNIAKEIYGSEVLLPIKINDTPKMFDETETERNNEAKQSLLKLNYHSNSNAKELVNSSCNNTTGNSSNSKSSSGINGRSNFCQEVLNGLKFDLLPNFKPMPNPIPFSIPESEIGLHNKGSTRLVIRRCHRISTSKPIFKARFLPQRVYGSETWSDSTASSIRFKKAKLLHQQPNIKDVRNKESTIDGQTRLLHGKTRYQESLPPRVSRSRKQRLIPLRVERFALPLENNAVRVIDSSSYLNNALLRMLRDINVSVIAFIDDMLIVGSTKEECLSNLKKTMDLLVKLGFKLNLEKSVLEPTQSITFLGLQIDSVSMKLLVPKEKKKSVINEIRNFLKLDCCSPRKLAGLTGKLIALKDAVIPFRLNTRRTNKFHSQCLTLANGDWDQTFPIPRDVKSEISHWLTVLNQWNGKEISLFLSYDYVLKTDASEYGATLKKGNKTIKTWSVQWSTTQSNMSSNRREIHALLMAYQALWWSDTGPISSVRTTLETMPQEESELDWRAYSRILQCKSRPPQPSFRDESQIIIQSNQELQLATEEGSVQSNPTSVRSNPNGSVQ
ncbi:hypothetical protein ACTFIW_003870 [Dictyostelium discoideum]